MAFNSAMTSPAPTELHPDAQLIERLGGPSVVARALGFEMPRGVQRVQNWKYRGIPEVLLLKRADVFFPPQPEGQGVADAA